MTRRGRSCNIPVRGFSLTEVMIALSLGMVVLLAALQIYGSSQKGSRTLVAQALLSSEGRAVAALLNNELSKIPNWGCWSDDNDATTTSDGLVIHALFNGAVLSPLLGAADVSGMSDSLIINGASLEAQTVLASDTDFTAGYDIEVSSLTALDLEGEAIGASDVIAIHNCIRSDVVTVASVDETTSSITVDCGGCSFRDYSAGATVSRVERIKLFVHDDNLCMVRDLSASDCSANDVLLGNVVNLQALYGIDSDSDADVDRYALGKHLTTNDWKKIQTVDIQLLIRSSETAVFDSPQTYLYQGDSVVAGDKRAYKSVSVTANLRNYKLY